MEVLRNNKNILGAKQKISFIEAVRLLGDKLGINIGNINAVETKKDDYFEIYEYANKFFL